MPKLRFSVDSALLSELGEKLVESVHIALIELVRNSYDADATKVTVSILRSDSGAPSVHVEDNGSGMTFQDVQDYWMRIATPHKVKKDVSSLYGRPLAGSKGIGRFSCRRLGPRLAMATTARVPGGHYEQTEVTFDWSAFEPGLDVTDIVCEGTRRDLPAAETGTTIHVSGASQNEWSRRGLNFLKRHLAVLVASRGARRQGYAYDPGFNMRLVAPDFDEDIRDLRAKLISAGWGTLTASVDRKGMARYSLNAMKVGRKKIVCAERFPHLAGTRLKLGIMPDRRAQMRNTAVISQGTLGEILSSWGGICVRHRGLRVFPYGEPGNDWLGIDKDRAIRKGSLEADDLTALAKSLQGVNPGRVLLQMLSARSYIGTVEIGLDVVGLQVKTNREGFVEGEALRELRTFVRYGVDWATIYREHFLRLLEREEAERARDQFQSVVREELNRDSVIPSAASYLESEARSLASQLPTRERQQVQKSLSAASEAIRSADVSRRQELRHLRLVASTSTLLLIFSHEVKAFVGGLDTVGAQMRTIQRGTSGKTASLCGRVRDDLVAAKERFIELLDMTALVSTRDHAATPSRIALSPRIEKAKRCFSLVINAYGIDVDVSQVDPRTKMGPMLEAELYAVLLNSLSNAIKAVVAGGRDKRIVMATDRTEDGTALHVRDTGVGLAASAFEDVFVPFVSDPEAKLYPSLDKRMNPEDKFILGTGSGLGLSILRDIVQSRGGTAGFVRAETPWKADLEIRMP